MPFHACNDNVFYYEDTGGSGPAIVFSHGFLTDHELFSAQASALQDRFRCVLWDQRFHGQSTAEGGAFTIEDATTDLLSLLDLLQIQRAVLVGFSFGGWISTRFALAHPERVLALVLIDSYERMESAEERDGYLGFKELVTRQGFDPEVTGIMLKFLFGGDFDASPWVAKWRFRPPGQWAHVYDAMLTRSDIYGRLREITCPSLVLHSEHNQANPPAVSSALASELGNCEGMVLIEGSGHTAPVERPGQVNDALAGFLQRSVLVKSR